MKLWIIAAAIAVAGFAGCGVKEIQRGVAVRSIENKAVVVMALTRSGNRDYELTVQIESEENDYRKLLFLNDYIPRDWKGLPDFVPTPEEKAEGRLIVFTAPPGEYIVSDWFAEGGLGTGELGNGFNSQTEGVDLRFKVNPGVVTYVGNLQIVLPMDLYYSRVQFYRIETPDTQERDLSLFRKRYPELGGGPLIMAPLVSKVQGKELRMYIFNNGNVEGRSN